MMNTQNKLIIGISSVLGLTLIALAFKDKWMPKKDKGGISLELQQDKVVESGGNASHNDSIGQKYILTADYNAMQSNSPKMVSKDFKIGSSFEKKSDKNLTMVNSQNAVKVFAENDEFAIPTTLLKKS